MLDLHYLKIFYEAGKERNFSKAARNLNISQSAVSIQIKNFEEELNTKLFDRKNNLAMELTYAGQVLFKTAQEIFIKVNRTDIKMQNIKNGMQDKITIGSTIIVGEPMLSKVIKELSLKDEKIKYEIIIQRKEILFDLLKEGKIDIALMGDFYIKDTYLEIININEFPFVLVNYEKIKNIKELEKSTLISRNDSNILEKNIDHLSNHYGLDIEKRITVNGSVKLIKNMVKEKMGYAILPYYCVVDEIKSGEFFPIVNFSNYKDGYQAVILKGNQDKEVLETIEFLKKFDMTFLNENNK